MLRKVFLIAALAGLPAHAQDSDIDALLTGLEDNASSLSVLKEKLDTPNSDVQQALFTRIMALETRPDLHVLAIHEALTSEATVLRSLAVWETLKRKGELVLEFGPKELSENEAGWSFSQDTEGGALSFALTTYSDNLRLISMRRADQANLAELDSNTVSLSGETLSFRFSGGSYRPNGNGALSLNPDGSAMVGFVDYSYYDSSKWISYKLPIIWKLR